MVRLLSKEVDGSHGICENKDGKLRGELCGIDESPDDSTEFDFCAVEGAVVDGRGDTVADRSCKIASVVLFGRCGVDMYDSPCRVGTMILKGTVWEKKNGVVDARLHALSEISLCRDV